MAKYISKLINGEELYYLKDSEARANLIDKSEKGAASGVATLDSSGKIPVDLIPSGIVSDVQSDWNQTDSTADDYIKNKPTSMPASDVSSWAKASTKPSYTKSEIGLGNVTNDAQVKRSEMGAASGVATLDSAGKVPSSQLPSYVDDVLEYNNKASFPATGESGKIYIDKATNLSWRWGGSDYVEISPSIALGETSSTAYAGDKGKALADKLATIASGAEVNVNADWNATSGDALILNKPTIPAAVAVKGNAESSYRTGNVNITAANIGLGNVGNFKAVSTVASQSLTDTEKSNARANIGAGTSSFSGNYNDLSNKPTIPAAANNGTYTVKTLVGSTTTNVSDFTANQSSADDVTLVQGTNVTLTPDATNRKITIAAKDTTYSAGSGLSLSGTTFSLALTKSLVTTALGYTPPTSDTNTWRTVQCNGTSIGNNTLNIKAGTNVSLSNSDGAITITSTDTNTWRPVGTGASDAAAGNHTHAISLATDSGTNLVTLAHGTKYKLTAGGKSVIFTTPSDNNTTYSAGSGLSLNGTTFSLALTKALVTSALGYTPPTSDTNTTYSAGTGLSLSGTTFSLALTKTLVTNALGYTPPTSDTNTHWTTRIYAGASGTAKNDSATSPYIKITDDNTYRNQIRLVGGGATTVTSDGSGNITISSTDTNTNTTYSAGTGLSLSGTTFSLALTKTLVTNALGYTPPTTNTTYSAGTLALYNTGTDTANRVWSASVLKSIGNKYLPLSGGTMTGSVDFGNKAMSGVSDIDGVVQIFHYPNTATPTNDFYACRVSYKDMDNAYLETVNSTSARGLRYFDGSKEQNLWMLYKADGDQLYVGDSAVVTTVRGENTRLLCFDGSTAHYCFLANKQGNVCIGEYANRVYTHKLNVVGAVGATAYNNTSDIRKKDIIENVDISVEDIANAPIFKFLWLDPEMDAGVNIGSSAQYWQTILPEIVSEADDDENTLSMQYGVAALTSSVTLAKKVVEQEKTIKAQEERIKALEDAILEILSKLNN